MGAVDYVFARIAPDNPEKPRVGVIGFGLGAAAALVALDREKGGAEVIRVFSGDSEGGSGFLAIQPLSVKRLRFCTAVEPLALQQMLPRCIRNGIGGWALWLLPSIDLVCRWRGGYPLAATALDKSVREAHVPLLYVASEANSKVEMCAIQRLYMQTPDPKQICRLKTAADGVNLIDTLLTFAGHHSNVPYPEPGAAYHD